MRFVFVPRYDCANSDPPDADLEICENGIVILKLHAPEREVQIRADDWQALMRMAPNSNG